MVTFKENINRICREKGTSLTRVMTDLGLSKSKVSAINGGSLPKEDLMVKLAHSLDCSVMDFFAQDIDLMNRQDDEYMRSPEFQASLKRDIENTHSLIEEDYINSLPSDIRGDIEDIVKTYKALSRADRHEFMSTVYRFGRRSNEGSNLR